MSASKYLQIGFGIVVIAALIIVPMGFQRYGLFNFAFIPLLAKFLAPYYPEAAFR